MRKTALMHALSIIAIACHREAQAAQLPPPVEDNDVVPEVACAQAEVTYARHKPDPKAYLRYQHQRPTKPATRPAFRPRGRNR